MHNVRKNTLQDLKKNIFSLLLIKKFGQENGKTQECCLKKPHGITELQNFEQLQDAIFYTDVCNPEVVPKMAFFNTKWLRQY